MQSKIISVFTLVLIGLAGMQRHSGAEQYGCCPRRGTHAPPLRPPANTYTEALPATCAPLTVHTHRLLNASTFNSSLAASALRSRLPTAGASRCATAPAAAPALAPAAAAAATPPRRHHIRQWHSPRSPGGRGAEGGA